MRTSAESPSASTNEDGRGKPTNKWVKRVFIVLGSLTCFFILLITAGFFFLKWQVNAANKRAGFVEAWSEENGTIYKDIVYDHAAKLEFDLYIPAAASTTKSHGACLFIHGGSWMGGSRKELTYAARRFAKAGYISATMDYSLISKKSPNNVYRMLDDIDHAIAALKAKTGELGFSVNKLALSGFSSGGHLSMLYGYSRARDSAIPIVLVLAQVAPTDFHPDTWGGKETDYGLVSLLTGKQITAAMIESGEAEAIVRSVSPVSFVTERTVPSVVAYGLKDTLVRPRHLEKIVTAFKARGVEHTAIEFQNSTHGLDADPDSRDRFKQVSLEYIRRAFGY